MGSETLRQSLEAFVFNVTRTLGSACEPPSLRVIGETSKILKPVKGQKVGVVIIMRAALFVVERRAARGNDVVAFELPVHILKPMFDCVGVA